MNVHRLLRRFLPRSFREAHGREMERVFRERLRAAREGGAGPGRTGALWLGEAWDLALTGLRLRLSRSGSAAGSRFRGPGGRDDDGGRRSAGWPTDLANGARSLTRRPAFLIFAAGTLALGIGSTVTFAAVLDRAVLRPVEFPDAGRLVSVWRTRGDLRTSPTAGMVERLRELDGAFEAVAGYRSEPAYLSTEEGVRVLTAVRLDPELVRMSGLSPIVGRWFGPEDASGATGPTVILSQGLWTRHFGADPAVVGRSVRLDGELRTVVGVAPETLRPPGPGRTRADLWLPLPPGGAGRGLNAVAHLAPGVGVEGARERVAALNRGLAEEGSAWSLEIVRAGELASRPLLDPLRAVGAAVGLLLLIACLNAANLFLARADARRTETAVRAALGAGRFRLAREALAESAVVALVGAVGGLGLAAGAVELIRSFRPERYEVLAGLSLDPVVVGAAVGLSAATALLFGTLPLVRRVRSEPARALSSRRATGSRDSSRLRRALLVGEVALSFVLLAGALQLAGSLHELRSRDPGVAADELLAVAFRLPEWRYPGSAERVATRERLLERVRSLPGVASATVASDVPPETSIFFGVARGEDEPEPGPDAPSSVFFGGHVAPGYFRTVGQRLLEGRAFRPSDLDAEPEPWILGASAARKHFPDGSAVGRRFRLGDTWHPVVGVVSDVWATGSAGDPQYPQLYQPIEGDDAGLQLVVRTDDPAGLAPRIREMVRDVDPEIPILSMAPLDRLYRNALARERLLTAILAAFAATAGGLAAVGLYGVVRQVALRRVREFGLRIALGSEARQIFGLVLRTGIVTVAVGLGAGAAGAWAGLRLLEVGIAGLEAPRLLAFGAAALVLATATLAACALPARRAARVDPVEALRTE